MFKLSLSFTRYEDGQRVQQTLAAPDRWAVHEAESVLVTLADLPPITVVQQPKSLTATKIGVGACLWDGAILLAAYLVAQPRYKYVGARCVELGAGVGLVSVVLAQLGAWVASTDIEKVLPLLWDNLEANGFHQTDKFSPDKGYCVAEELEWGKEGWVEGVVKRLSEPPLDLVLAADCCYIDQDGKSPSTEDFVKTCHGLCTQHTRCLVAFERRSTEVRKCFVEEAQKMFSRVRLLPMSELPLRLEYCDLWELKL